MFRIPYAGREVEISLDDECVWKVWEKIDEHLDCRIAGLWRVIDVDDGKGTGTNYIVLKCNREDVGINPSREVREDLEVFEKAFVNIYSDL